MYILFQSGTVYWFQYIYVYIHHATDVSIRAFLRSARFVHEFHECKGVIEFCNKARGWLDQKSSNVIAIHEIHEQKQISKPQI